MMDEQLTELLMGIDRYVAKTVSADDLEQCTLLLISDDAFDTLDSDLQDEIYALDSKELNDLSQNDIMQIRNIISKHVVMGIHNDKPSEQQQAEIKIFARQWIATILRGQSSDQNNDVASETMDGLVRYNPAIAVSMMQSIIDTSDDKAVLANLGAGPLEDLLGSEAGKVWLPNILKHARQNANWRLALGCV
jgi:hypothetical protein